MWDRKRTDVTVQAGRCAHCGRDVRYTVHGRTGVRVDYYRSVTGVPQVDLVEDPSGSGASLRLVRVESLREILTCRECWTSPGTQAALREARRTGILQPQA